MKKTTATIKRAIALCMALVAALTVLTVFAGAADAADEFKLQYFLSEGWDEEETYAYVTGYEGTVPQTLVIPERYEDRPVVGIDTGAFRNCKTVEELVMPDSLYWIESRAFLNCTNLKTIRFGEQAYQIGVSAFENCVSLEALDLRDVLYITPYAFAGCSALQTVSTKAFWIGEYAFDRCSCLESVLITGYYHENCADDWEYTGNHHFFGADWDWIHYDPEVGTEYYDFDAAYDDVFTLDIRYDMSASDTCYWYQDDYNGFDIYDIDEGSCTCHAGELGGHSVYAEVVDADGNVVYREINYIRVSYTQEQQLRNSLRALFQRTLFYRILRLLMNRSDFLRDLWIRYFA